MRKKQRYSIFFASAVAMILAAGCSGWERQAPIFVPESEETIMQQEQPPLEEDVYERTEGATAEVLTVQISSTTDTEKTWKTQDEVLAQSLYDAIQLKNEEYESLDIRPYDYDIIFTGKDDIQWKYGMWINFTRDNNVIIRDESGALWDIPIYDSNRFRVVLSALK